MKRNQIRITGNGITRNTKITTYKGESIGGLIAKVNLSIDASQGTSMAALQFIAPNVDVVADCLNIEHLAKELHDAGRTAVEAGLTVAAEKFGEEPKKFLEWEEVTENVRDGRREQAIYLLKRFHIMERQP